MKKMFLLIFTIILIGFIIYAISDDLKPKNMPPGKYIIVAVFCIDKI